MPKATIRSPLDRRISPEVRGYLQSRGIPEPDCPPLYLTPEPRKVPGARFDPDRVDHVLNVFSRLRHTKGQWAGRPLKPDPWQVAYFIAPVFGWVRPDGLGGWVRIIREAYVEVPRKNGKTTIAGGVAIYLTTADGEPGAEVYAVASGKDQARFCFDPVKALAEKAPDLKPYVKALRDRIVHKASLSYFAVVSHVADLLQGGNVHGAIIDELHVHKSPDMVRAIESGTASRRQPLTLTITTAGDEDEETIYAEEHRRIIELAEKVIADPTTFGVIWAGTLHDDPFAEATWKKTNPGYGISPSRDFMVKEATKAQQSPGKLASFLRFNLNIRTSADVAKPIDLTTWDRAAGMVVEEKLKGRPCFAGLDLSQTKDFTAFSMVFRPDDPEQGAYQVVSRFWLPEEDLEERGRRDGVDYRPWTDRGGQGFIRLTPGNSIDYETVERDILAEAKRFRIMEAAFDPRFAYEMAEKLTKRGLLMIPFQQSMATMGPPFGELLGLLKDRRFQHGGNPVLRRMANATHAELDANGLMRPSKRKSKQRIDGIVAATMGLDRALRRGAGRPALLGTA